jgi:hypothetical protein
VRAAPHYAVRDWYISNKPGAWRQRSEGEADLVRAAGERADPRIAGTAHAPCRRCVCACVHAHVCVKVYQRVYVYARGRGHACVRVCARARIKRCVCAPPGVARQASLPSRGLARPTAGARPHWSAAAAVLRCHSLALGLPGWAALPVGIGPAPVGIGPAPPQPRSASARQFHAHGMGGQPLEIVRDVVGSAKGKCRATAAATHAMRAARPSRAFSPGRLRRPKPPPPPSQRTAGPAALRTAPCAPAPSLWPRTGPLGSNARGGSQRT